jgi:Mlc titration factor MtfA (ptsG expression regulator)
MRRFRRNRDDDEFPEAWLATVESELACWSGLSPSERSDLLDLTWTLLVDKRWEAAQGFELTDEMRVTIAVHAALLVLGLDYGCYRSITSIIVHPTTIEPRRSKLPDVFVVPSLEPPLVPLLGETSFDGPILVAWDALRDQARHPERGHNVVFHEFAHRLDMLDGISDGTPPLDPAVRERWIRVCQTEFDAIRAGGGNALIDTYAATNPAEFFAVVTEVFFDRGAELEQSSPALYDMLREFYRQDPARRSTRTE